jgi:hypothetical protein
MKTHSTPNRHFFGAVKTQVTFELSATDLHIHLTGLKSRNSSIHTKLRTDSHKSQSGTKELAPTPIFVNPRHYSPEESKAYERSTTEAIIPRLAKRPSAGYGCTQMMC